MLSTIKKAIGIIENWITEWRWKLLYIFILTVSTCYLWCNWTEAVTFTFFNDFNGVNLIFVVWIFLWLAPFIKSIEILGIKAQMKEKEKLRVKEKEAEFEFRQHINATASHPNDEEDS